MEEIVSPHSGACQRERKGKKQMSIVWPQKNIVELRVSESLEVIVSNVENLLRNALRGVYLQSWTFVFDPAVDELVSISTNCTAPKTAAEALNGCKVHERTTITDVTPCLRNLFSGIPRSGKVVFWPVQDESGKRIVVLSLILVQSHVSEIFKTLDSLARHVMLSYKAVLAKILDGNKLKLLRGIGSLFNDDFSSLSKKIVERLCDTLNAESGTVLIVDKLSDELYTNVLGNVIYPNEYRFQVVESGFLFLYSNPRLQSFEVGQTSQLGSDLTKLIEFRKSDMKVESALIVPALVEGSNEVVALVCLFNKIGTKKFTRMDEELISSLVCNATPMILNSLKWRTEVIIRRQNIALLEVAKNLFSHLDDVTVLLHKIMEEARHLMKAERCSFFLVDQDRRELVAKVFDGVKPVGTEVPELRIPITHGIVGHVAQTGRLLNIRDAYSHPLFYRDVDVQTGFKTRHILCFPILNDKEVIGVAQLVNKINGHCFTQFDEELTVAFAIFCSLSLVQSLLYKKAFDAQQRSRLANELMLYHMRVSDIDIEMYTNSPFPTKETVHEEMDKFHFIPRLTLANHDSIKVVIAMLNDLGFINNFKMKPGTLVRFMLVAKKGYRDPPYHNWVHAWTCAHFCYLLLKNTKVKEYLSELEMFVLFIACLCHDLDHRGTTNSFQVSSKSILASLYSSEGSVMEQHHLHQAMCIINSEGCNIFESLRQRDYSEALDLMQMIILATDLANHFKIAKEMDEMIHVAGYDQKKPRHHELLLSLMMTCCDLSDQSKPWEGAFAVSDLLYAEFFAQGDMEKSLGYTPIEMMDREKASIPKLQIDFLSKVAKPIYKLLAGIFPETACIEATVEANKDTWKTFMDSGGPDGS